MTFLLTLVIVVLVISAVTAVDQQLASTITIAPNRKFCYFEDKRRDDNTQYGARYQVKEGTVAVEVSLFS
jgi:hypothetical protein